MGMFDFVKYSAKCIKCGDELADFQTKDGPMAVKVLLPEEAKFFYSLCDKCKSMNHFFYTKNGVKRWLGSDDCDCGFGDKHLMGDIDVGCSNENKLCVVSGDSTKFVKDFIELECEYCGKKTKTQIKYD